MNNKRQKVRKHISAARDWLGRAETSMDKENDVRSDLDMMLAQAELQRAQETKLKSGWRRWLVRLAPLLLAALVGIGYAVFLQQERPTPVVSPIEAFSSKQETSPQVLPEIRPENQSSDLRRDGVTENKAEVSGATREETVYQSDEHRTPPAVEPDTEAKSKPLPEADMQKLMQAAGKTLRE